MHANISDCRPGSPWEHRRIDGSQLTDVAGTVLESTPPTRLALTWANPVDGTPVAGAGEDGGTRPDGPSRVMFDIDGDDALSRLTVTHDRLAGDGERAALEAGWAAALSNLKTFLETGHPLRRPPWEMPPGFVRGAPLNSAAGRA